jgi:hypothetical protein
MRERERDLLWKTPLSRISSLPLEEFEVICETFEKTNLLEVAPCVTDIVCNPVSVTHQVRVFSRTHAADSVFWYTKHVHSTLVWT